MDSIPEELLCSVVQCYQSAKEYCKRCFYRTNNRYGVSLGRGGSDIVCSHCRRAWESVVVIPRSKLCSNFGNFEFLPIAPLPEGKPSRGPYEYCRKQDHYRFVIGVKAFISYGASVRKWFFCCCFTDNAVKQWKFSFYLYATSHTCGNSRWERLT